MSKFVTTLPVDIDAALKLLPEGAALESVSFNGRGIDIIWDHRPFHTGLDFPIPFPPEDLAARKLPAPARLKTLSPRCRAVAAGHAPPNSARTRAPKPIARKAPAARK